MGGSQLEAEFRNDLQERLERSNKLHQSSKKDGMGVANAQPSGGSGSNRDSPDKRRGGSIFGNVFGSSNSIASSHDTPPGPSPAFTACQE